MQQFFQYNINGDSRVRTLEEIASFEDIPIKRLRASVKYNTDLDIIHLVKYLKTEGSFASNKLYPISTDDGLSYLSINQAAKANNLSPDSIRVHMQRNPLDSLSESIEKLKANKAKTKKNTSLKKIASSRGISLSVLKETHNQFKGRLSEEQIVSLAIAQEKTKLFSTVLQNSSVGLRKERRGRHSVWVSSYKDENGEIRDMTINEIAKIEGLEPASLLKAINREGNTKSIYDIVNEMVERSERTALYDLADHYGVDRRMWIYRVNKYKHLPLDTIAKLTRKDEKKLKLNPRKERDEPLPMVDGMSLSRFGYTNGTSSRTVIRRYDAGIEPEYTIGRRTPVSFYTYKDITLSLSEISLVSGIKADKIRQSIKENPEQDLLSHLKMTVDEFYAKLDQLKLLWTLPRTTHTHAKAKLFTYGSMTFTLMQLSHIACVSESTVRRRSKNSNNVLEITHMDAGSFMKRIFEIESKHASTMDAASLTTDFTDAQKQESRLRAIRNNYAEAKRNADSALNSLKTNGFSLIDKSIDSSTISIVPCDKCLSSPEVKNQENEIKICCPKCGNGNDSEYTDYLGSLLEWCGKNIGSLTYSDLKLFKGVDIQEMDSVKRSQFFALLETYYTNEMECTNQIAAAFSFPQKMRKRYEMFSQSKKLEVKNRLEVSIKIVSLLKKISMNSSLWSHIQ